MTESSLSQFFATCPKGLEGLLNQELKDLGSSETRETVAGVYFSGDIQLAYKACLWSRLANKILLPLSNGSATKPDELYGVAKSIDWENHIGENTSISVDFFGSNTHIRHTQYGAQTVKDAVVDRIREHSGSRPNVDTKRPDIRINVRLSKNIAYISLDMSGDSLHRRGYRRGQGGAPLKENLACAILLRAGWPKVFAEGGALIDPMCGSATFLIEGTMMALDMAPGLLRARATSDAFQNTENENPLGDRFGFEKWLKHKTTAWQALVEEAEHRYSTALTAGGREIDGTFHNVPEIRGYDKDSHVLFLARLNIVAAGLDDFIRVTEKSVSELKKPTHKEIEEGLLICNPPYGERLGEIEALRETYLSLADSCKKEFPGWQLAVFTGNKELGRELRLRSKKKYQLFNGAIASELLLFDISQSGTIAREADKLKEALWQDEEPELAPTIELSSGAQMIANRLRKNLKKYGKWLKKDNISCYRVYDADMPEYAAAIDLYTSINDEPYLHIQEYAPPKTINEHKAATRFDELVLACKSVFELDNDAIFTKTRRRNRGKQQYEKQNSPSSSNTFHVQEGDCRLEINLSDYIDSGLFLDHRPVRKMIAQSSKGKSFLNLFCYTASATVHAACAGASSSVSVDMSNTYLTWAQRNFNMNNLSAKQHQLVRANCFDWLKQCREGFDIIMLDPPSFSNSKKMSEVLDVQKDHVILITRCMELLKPGGVLYFSNNLRSFKMDASLPEKYQVQDITRQSLDMDYQGNPKIHNCWKISSANIP
ncbi:23S rRNA m(2)G-2445 methyltransferase [Alteromonadaceae bacterium Bs31]|nr:23S rRNA m(2)G-2445 methyltransferase [Alteromonadaceae bacterium Bs31]